MISRARQLASITAVGASAIALTVGKAEAATIIVSSVLDTTVGFTSDAIPNGNGFIDSHIFNTFASGPNFAVKAGSNNASSGFSLNANIFRNGKFTTIAVRTPVSLGTPHIALFAFGATWGSVKNQADTADLGARRFNTASIGGGYSLDGHPGFLSFTDEYLLFTFQQDSTTDYGWIEASMSVTGTNSVAPNGPDVTIVQYAFDNTGVPISAGDTGSSPGPSPEPSSLAESGLAALILGAEGLRRWRKARKAAVGDLGPFEP